MADWLLAHQTALQTGLLLAILVGLLAWETWLPRRAFAVPLGGRWFNQIALAALGSVAVRLCAPIAAVSLAALAQREGWGLLNFVAVPPWLAVVLGVIAIDLGIYLLHRSYHAVPLLWRFHQIHHSDLDIDCGTALRHHPVETIINQAFDLALIAVIGIPPLAVVIGVLVTSIASVFNHANVAVLPAADRVLRWLIVTPDMHRIHHSVEIEESNRNFANIFAWWDYLFSTYQREPQRGQTQMAVGLAEARGDRDFRCGSSSRCRFVVAAPAHMTKCVSANPRRPPDPFKRHTEGLMNARSILGFLWLSLASGTAAAGVGAQLPEPGILELLAMGAVVGVAIAIRRRRK
jgi:sterol desaturase/sphingolipid hydroxylase (fatty acid hydroxylase superfamily)